MPLLCAWSIIKTKITGNLYNSLSQKIQNVLKIDFLERM